MATKKATSCGPAPFSNIGSRAKDLLTKDYNYDHKFSLYIRSSTGMGITATGVKKKQIFVGGLIIQFKSEKATVDVTLGTSSNVSTKVTYDVSPRTKATISFKAPEHKSGKSKDFQVFTKVTYDVLPGTKAGISFKVPDQNSGKLDVHYLHPRATITSSIGLNATPLLEVSAAFGSKDIFIGGEIAFNTSSSSCTKLNAGISFNKLDFSAALTLTDKGKTLKASYVHSVNPRTGTEVAAEMVHKLSNSDNSFSIGSVHKIDRHTLVKTRFSDNGKIAVLGQTKWRSKSLVTVSSEYNTKKANVAPKVGLAITLKP